jgi:hypothetical protein
MSFSAIRSKWEGDFIFFALVAIVHTSVKHTAKFKCICSAPTELPVCTAIKTEKQSNSRGKKRNGLDLTLPFLYYQKFDTVVPNAK